MAKIISGKELSAKLKLEMADEVKTFPAKYGRVPHLVVILVGEDPGSVAYVAGKHRDCAVRGKCCWQVRLRQKIQGHRK